MRLSTILVLTGLSSSRLLEKLLFTAMKPSWLMFTIITLYFNITLVTGALRRCYTCRSRGDLGSCKDPFRFNATLVESERGVETVPCASGWCAKMIEGGSTFSDSEYGMATQRLCLPRGPSDSEERCAQTIWSHKKVYMCFCQGDLCNSAFKTTSKFLLTLIIAKLLYIVF